MAYELGVLLLTVTGVLQTVVAARIIRVGGNRRRRILLSADSLVMPLGFMSKVERDDTLRRH